MEYVSELSEDHKVDYNVMKCNFAGPPFLKDEIWTAITKIKSSKATGPVSISVDLLEALEDYRIDKITTLLNEIYDTGQIPLDISKPYCITQETRGDRVSIERSNQSYESYH